jgi:hypothetical protein
LGDTSDKRKSLSEQNPSVSRAELTAEKKTLLLLFFVLTTMKTIKVKFALEQTTKAYRKNISIALLFL